MSSMLSNSGWQIISGSWQVENSGSAAKSEKIITCKSAGVLSLPLSVPYGTWKFDLYKGADANGPLVMLGATLPDAYTTTGQNGYITGFSSTEAMVVSSVANGSPTTRMASAASYISTTGWYSIIVKRYTGGVFYTYIKGGTQFPTWTLVAAASGNPGTNPFTNNTYTTSQFVNLQLGTNDAIKNIEMSPDFNKILVGNGI